MGKVSKLFKCLALGVTGASLWALGGCVPDKFWVEKSGEIINGLIISALNLVLQPTGLAI